MGFGPGLCEHRRISLLRGWVNKQPRRGGSYRAFLLRGSLCTLDPSSAGAREVLCSRLQPPSKQNTQQNAVDHQPVDAYDRDLKAVHPVFQWLIEMTAKKTNVRTKPTTKTHRTPDAKRPSLANTGARNRKERLISR